MRIQFIEQEIAQVQERSIRSNTLLEEAPLGMVVVDDDGLIIQTNRYLEDLFGYERKELVGSSMEIHVAESLRHAHTSHRAGYIQNPASRLTCTASSTPSFLPRRWGKGKDWD